MVRDKVVAIELRYRTQGNLRDMTDTVKYYFDEIYLEKVEQPEHFEGWHDPGDLSQNTMHTSDGVYNFLSLAEKLRNHK